MASVRISKETEQELQICREPSTKAWAILVGVTSLGIGAAYYCNDWFLWKLIYISGAVFVGLSCFEDWEECTFNKKDGQVKLKTESAFQKIFGSENNKTVAADLSELVGVSVREEEVRYAGKGYMVVLLFETGISLGITETAILGDKSELEAISRKIIAFTGLEQISEDDGSVEDNTVSSSTNDIEIVGEELDDVPESVNNETDSEASLLMPNERGLNNESEAQAAPVIPIAKVSSESQAAACVPQDGEGEVTSTQTLKDSDSSSSDEGFEKIEKPPSDVPIE